MPRAAARVAAGLAPSTAAIEAVVDAASAVRRRDRPGADNLAPGHDSSGQGRSPVNIGTVETVVWALRGATTVDEDSEEHIFERVIALLDEIFERNQLGKEAVISVIFTATDDIHSVFPAAAARKFGLGDVPLLCARELDIEDGTPRCVRVLMHVNTSTPRSDLRHVYLEGAATLRDDLPG